MKLLPAILLIFALAAAGSADAQTMPRPTPNPQMRQAFGQLRSQMQTLHRNERTQILAALTPEHRALLASIAGELTTSATPDYDAAAKRLDAALSPSEAQAVLRAAQNARTQARSIMQNLRNEFPSPPNGPGMRRMGARGMGALRGEGHSPDAGRILLHLMMGGPMFMHPGMPGGAEHP
jgi:hypothetical protein